MVFKPTNNQKLKKKRKMNNPSNRKSHKVNKLFRGTKKRIRTEKEKQAKKITQFEKDSANRNKRTSKYKKQKRLHGNLDSSDSSGNTHGGLSWHHNNTGKAIFSQENFVRRNHKKRGVGHNNFQ